MRVKLSDITQYSKGVQINGDELVDNGDYIYLNGGINPSGRWTESNVGANTVTISEGGNSSGYINYITEPFWCGAHCYYLFNGPKNTKYLYYALKSQQDRLLAIRSGACMPNIKKSDLGKFEFEFDINEQKQNEIVATLSRVENVIACRKRELELLDDLIKARFVEMFGDAVANPMNWPIKELKDLSVQINSGNTPKGGSENYVEEGIAFFRSQNVWKDCLKMDDIAYIDEETHAKMKRSSLKQGDILMTKTGRINTENSSLGRAALYMGEDDMANVNGHVYFIRLKPEVNNKFVLRILVSDEYRDLIRSVCVGGIDKRQLNKEHIEDFPIICPPDYMVDKYVSFVEQVDKSKVAVQKALDETQTLFDSLMQEYFG